MTTTGLREPAWHSRRLTRDDAMGICRRLVDTVTEGAEQRDLHFILDVIDARRMARTIDGGHIPADYDRTVMVALQQQARQYQSCAGVHSWRRSAAAEAVAEMITFVTRCDGSADYSAMLQIARLDEAVR